MNEAPEFELEIEKNDFSPRAEAGLNLLNWQSLGEVLDVSSRPLHPSFSFICDDYLNYVEPAKQSILEWRGLRHVRVLSTALFRHRSIVT
jgi:hypothetical protein